MTAHEEDLVSLEEVRSVLTAYAGPDYPRERPARRRLGRYRPVLLAVVAVSALAGAGVAIAAGFGAFNGISAAQNTQTGSDILPPALLAQIQQSNASVANNPAVAQQLPDTARVLGTLPDGSKVYGLSDTRGDLCTISEAGGSCGPPLSNAQPITFGGANDAPTAGGTFIASGVALDGVTSVSFTPVPGAGKEVTVPVKNNVWVYREPDSHASNAHCIAAHLADGSTVNPFPEVPCP
jgi:hypothetical protein